MTAMTQCALCEGPMTPQVRKSGRRKRYCSKACMSKSHDIQRRETYRVMRDKRVKVVILREIVTPPQPVTWWVAQAMGVMEWCGKCQEPAEGIYVPPTRETMNECAVVAHCRCGWERVVLAGMAGVPYEDQARGVVMGPRRRENTSRRAL